jgi:hypothetical protein
MSPWDKLWESYGSCDIVKNGSTFLYNTHTMHGFAGTGVNSYSDSTGTSPAYDYTGIVTVNAGDTIDIQGGGGHYVGMQAEIGLPPTPGTVSGFVRANLSGTPAIAGALVQVVGGTEQTTTGTDGSYSLLLPAGTYQLRASKASFDAQTISSVTVTSGGTTSCNFSLNASFITGQVTVAGTTNQPVVGASVRTSDGAASAVTDSAGNYSLQVSSGTYTVVVSKTNYQTQQASVSVPANTAVPQNFALTTGWDFAGDFALADPNGPWWYGYDTGSGFATFSHIWEVEPQIQFMTENWSGSGMMGKNTRTYAYGSNNWGYTGCHMESGQAVIAPPATGSIIARFVAPVGGYFTLQARLTAQTCYSPYTEANVSIVRNDTEVLMPATSLSGFIGTSAASYGDSTGTSLVVTYDQSISVSPSDRIELKATGAGWVGVDFTISVPADASYASGKVTSNTPAGFPLIGAQVTFIRTDGPGGSYQTFTGEGGNYVLTLPAGTYRVIAEKTNHNTYDVSGQVIASGSNTKDIQLTHNGTWDFAGDFTNLMNPNGQWAYGEVSDDEVNPTFYPFTDTSWDAFSDGCAVLRDSRNASVWKYLGENPAATTSGIYWLEPGQVGISGCWLRPSVRWTAPANMIARINVRASAQYTGTLPQPFSWGPPAVQMLRNGSSMFQGQVWGFAGRSTKGYTDSAGPSPVATFDTALPIAAGDVIELRGANKWGWDPDGPKDIAIDWQIAPFTGGLEVSTVKQIKDAAVDTVVFMTTPKALVLGTKIQGFTDGTFYVEEDDRSSGIKLIGNATTPDIPVSAIQSYKITFTGKVAMLNGQKVVQVMSINSAAPATPLKPLGISSKALTASNMLVRVWGKLLEKVANTDPAANTNWPYLYWTINDGGVNVKVPMIGQQGWMNTPSITDPIAGEDYVGVTGIARLDASGQLVVMPWNEINVSDYTEHL